MIPSWLGMLIVIVSLAGALGLVRLVQAWRPLHPEIARKSVHVLLGLVTLTFPWLFPSVWPVVALAIISAGFLLAIRVVPTLRARYGKVLGAVDRTSLGEVYFPIAVAILFVAVDRDPVLYGVPILILTVADAIAALVGSRYGTLRFATFHDYKSVEGSLAFFLATFLSVHIPLLLFTETGRAECLLLAVTVGLVVTLIEAVAWRGLDNLLIPLGAALIIVRNLERPASALLILAAVTFGLFMFMMIWRRRTTLKDNALLGGILIAYLMFSWGGWQWIVAPVLLFGSYTALWPAAHEHRPQRQDVHAVASVAGAGLLWLLLARTGGDERLLYPYTLSFAAHLAMIGAARLAHARPRMNRGLIVLWCTLKSCVVMFIPFLFIAIDDPAVALLSLSSLPIVALACGAFVALQLDLETFPMDHPRWILQAFCALGASALGLLPLLVGAESPA